MAHCEEETFARHLNFPGPLLLPDCFRFTDAQWLRILCCCFVVWLICSRPERLWRFILAFVLTKSKLFRNGKSKWYHRVGLRNCLIVTGRETVPSRRGLLSTLSSCDVLKRAWGYINICTKMIQSQSADAPHPQARYQSCVQHHLLPAAADERHGERVWKSPTQVLVRWMQCDRFLCFKWMRIDVHYKNKKIKTHHTVLQDPYWTHRQRLAQP